MSKIIVSTVVIAQFDRKAISEQASKWIEETIKPEYTDNELKEHLYNPNEFDEHFFDMPEEIQEDIARVIAVCEKKRAGLFRMISV